MKDWLTEKSWACGDDKKGLEYTFYKDGTLEVISYDAYNGASVVTLKGKWQLDEYYLPANSTVWARKIKIQVDNGSQYSGEILDSEMRNMLRANGFIFDRVK